MPSSPPTSGAAASPSSYAPAGKAHIDIQGDALKGLAIQVWHPWFGVEAGLFDSQIAEFNQHNPWGIVVQSSGQTGYTQLYDHVTASLPTASRPQLVVALPEDAVAWDNGGYVVDLTGFVDDPQYGLTESDVHDVPTVFWTQDEVGGKRLGIPAERSAGFLLYNESWARELGFDAAPQSASAFRAQACKAHQGVLADADKTNDAQGGWLVQISPVTLLSWLSAFGGGVLEGSGYRFLTPKNLDALSFVKQLYDDGCSWTPQAGTNPALAFAERRALFATAGLEELTDYARAMASSDNGDLWTVLSFPGPEQAALATYGSSYAVLKSTPQEELASWLFVRWLLTPENQEKWVEATGLFPLRTSSLKLLGDYQKSHPQWSAAVGLLPAGQIEPQLASWHQVRVMLGDGFDAMYRSNTAPGRVAEILAVMDKTAGDIGQ